MPVCSLATYKETGKGLLLADALVHDYHSKCELYRSGLCCGLRSYWTVRLSKRVQGPLSRLSVAVSMCIDSFIFWPWLENVPENSVLQDKVVHALCEADGPVRFRVHTSDVIGQESSWEWRKMLLWEVRARDGRLTSARVLFPWSRASHLDRIRVIVTAFQAFTQKWNDMLPWKRMQWAYQYVSSTRFGFSECEEERVAQTDQWPCGIYSIFVCTWDQAVTLLAITFILQNPTVSLSRVKVLPQGIVWDASRRLVQLHPIWHPGLILCE